MSGHSHAKKIKHAKEITDKKRGQIFSKLSREISVAAKEGIDPGINTKLRLAIEKAKKWNLPGENIERAIKRGSGELAGEKLEEVLFEAYGPGGIAIIIEGIADNKNRAIGEIKQILNQHGGKLVGIGGVRWLFKRKEKEPGVLDWLAEEEISVDEKTKENCQKLFEALDENEAVQKIYSNIKA